jgi:hypothetical protein
MTDSATQAPHAAHTIAISPGNLRYIRRAEAVTVGPKNPGPLTKLR